jgi:pimeloyl-ACP methyl ester carboxylesterase
VTTPTDLVVVLPGILGSTLRQRGRLVWAPSGGAVLRAIATFGQAVRHLRLPDGLGDEHPGDGVEPVELMPDLHLLPGIWTPVKGYDRLLARLRSLGYHDGGTDPHDPAGNLVTFPYDWRLSNRYNASRLGEIVEPALHRWRAKGGRYAGARVTFVGHSMGGLIARWYIEKCGGSAITRKLITFGTPYRGALNALTQLVNGTRPGLGRLGEDVTGLARSMPSMYQLLPEYACIDRQGDLVKTTETTLPELNPKLVADGMRFHADLGIAETARPDSLHALHAIVGIHQPTATTARLNSGRIEPRITYRDQNLYGDATVPLVAATRADVPMDSPLLRRVPDQHGNLQRNSAALDELAGILTAIPVHVRATDTVAVRVAAPDVLLSGEPLTVALATVDRDRHPLRVTVADERGRLADARLPRLDATGTGSVTIEGLPPGAYTVDVTGIHPSSPISPVSTDIVVWAETA